MFPQASRTEQAAHRRVIRTALALACLSALLATGFFGLSRAVDRGVTENFDRRILLAMRETQDLSDPIGPRWVEEVGRDITALGGVTVIALLTCSITAFFWLADMRRASMYVAVASLGAFLIAVGLKHLFERLRPDLVPHGVMVYTSSFPSGHSTMSAAVYLTLGMVASRFVKRKRLKVLLVGEAMLVTAAVGVSRVYLGVHWPSDVLGGWAVGFSWALVCWCVATWLQDRGMIEPEVDPAASQS